jgi:alkanesulfonate monooxygenase SsuD/methylene tetrahydromethanopterin reductase-like flavin-dependent oxidoreductase (luciferase family)
LGIGYAFAAHFSHTPPAPAFEAYRYAFQATEAFPRPQTMLCVSVVCAPTDEEARYLSYSQAVQWALFMTGEQRRLMSPEEAHKVVLTPQQQGVIDHQSTLWIVGSPKTVSDTILETAQSCAADEVMITTTMHSYELRRRSYRLITEAFGVQPRD